MLRQVVSSLLTLSAVATPTLLVDTAAAEADLPPPIEVHFDAVKALISGEHHLVAQRQIEVFNQAGYDDPGQLYRQVLRLQFCDTFSVALTTEEASQYAAEAKRIRDALTPSIDNLPEKLQHIVKGAGKMDGLINQLVNSEVSPLRAVPVTPLTAEKKTVFLNRLAVLTEVTRQMMAETMVEINTLDEAREARSDVLKEEGEEAWEDKDFVESLSTSDL